MSTKDMLLSLTILVLSWSSLGLAASLQGRELNPLSTELTAPCTLYKRVADYLGGRSEATWVCHLDPADGSGFVEVKTEDLIDLTSAESGVTTISAPGMAIAENGLIIPDPTQVVFGETRRRDRRLAITGERKVTVVRVTCGNLVMAKSLDELKSDVFSDAVCLKSQMEACSQNRLTISQGPNNGGVEVSITDCTNDKVAAMAVTTALISTYGIDVTTVSADTHFMFCMPAGIFPNRDELAWGFMSGQLTAYNDDACSAVVVQMHEIGHNFGLDHANENGIEYDDLTGVMGFGDRCDDESMCFNAPNSYQLGWLTEVAEYTSQPGPAGKITLVGHTNFGGGIQAVRLQGAPTSDQDTYIWFNHASGINANTREGKDQVLVAHRLSGTMTAWSFLDAKLSVGDSYYPMGASYAPFQVLSIGNGQATITFDGSLPRPPTPAPTGGTPPPPTGGTPPPTGGTTPPPTGGTPPPTPVPPVIVCPKTRKRKECPEGCIFKNKKCKVPKVPKPKGTRAPKDVAASIVI